MSFLINSRQSCLQTPSVLGYSVPHAGPFERKAYRVYRTIFLYCKSSGISCWRATLILMLEPMSFDYFFNISVTELALSHGDNLSAALQSSTISAAEGQCIASLTATTIAKLRTDDSFSLFWDLVQKAAAAHVTEPSLPRRQKVP